MKVRCGLCRPARWSSAWERRKLEEPGSFHRGKRLTVEDFVSEGGIPRIYYGETCSRRRLFRRAGVEKLILFHGTPDKVVVPTYGRGEEKHDFGRGFYLTGSLDLAKEWAVCRPNETNGWVHKYELDTSDLKILDFQNMGFLGLPS